MWADLWKCPKCVETWRVQVIENIDVSRDKIYPVAICSVCNSEVTEKLKTPEGHQMVHMLTHEEIMADLMFGDEDDAEDESSCICDDDDLEISNREQTENDDLPF